MTTATFNPVKYTITVIRRNRTWDEASRYSWEVVGPSYSASGFAEFKWSAKRKAKRAIPTTITVTRSG